MTSHAPAAASDENQLTTRLDFMQLDAAARQELRALKPLLDKELPRALDLFYDRLRNVPQVRSFFTSEAHIASAKAAQVKHWQSISTAAFDDEFMKKVRRVGDTHARIGLNPSWYVGGYALIADTLAKTIIAEFWPKGMMQRGSAAKSEKAGAAVGAMFKAIFLDMDLAISTYLEALELQRKQAEATREATEKAAALAVSRIGEGLANLSAKKLDFRLDADFPETFRKLQVDFNAAIEQLSGAMKAVIDSADAIASGSGEIATASDDLSHRTEQQAASLEEAAAALDEITATVGKAADGAKHAREIVLEAKHDAERSSDVVRKAVDAMGRIERSSAEIGKIIGVIDEIAFQTNLLALNAGVEAARAGEAGRGFAVVASEVRALAQRSAEAAKEIKGLVNTSNHEVESGVKLVAETGQTLARIVSKVAEIDTVVGDIANSSQEQSSGLHEINIAINQLDQSTQQNAAMAEQATAASRSLTHETAQLASMINEFRTTRTQGSSQGSDRLRQELRKAAPHAFAPPAKGAPQRPAAKKVVNAPRGGSEDWADF